MLTFNKLISVQLAATLLLICRITVAVSPGRLNKLTREELLNLDYDVAQYYQETFDQLDRKNVSYDQYLFKSIKSARHSLVVEHFDFKYTSLDTMKKSMGSKVNKDLCKYQLKLLIKFAQRQSSGQLESLPLSVINFLESSARTGAGVLNGNFAWLGSPVSCVRARIVGDILQNHTNEIESQDNQKQYQQADINGRYCVAHLRGKSWPKWDIHFEDRITIRKALCLPESCHSYLYVKDQDIQRDVDYLARYNLHEPFNGDRYETTYLYCFPDEDSPHRQMDFGAKLFVVFVCFWILITIYANYKYNQRVETMKNLRNALDINEKRKSGYKNEQDANMNEAKRVTKDHQQTKLPELAGQQQEASECPGSLPVPPTVTKPLPSEAEEEEDEFSLVKARARSKAERKSIGESKSSGTGWHKELETGVDFIKAFSVEANLRHLFLPRQVENDDKQARVATTSSDETNSCAEIAKSEPDKSQTHKRRVNIEILDGIKVMGTIYIVHGHVVMFFFGLITDLRFASERMMDASIVMAINALQVVSLFYVVTGCLLTYFAFTKAKLKHLLNPLFWLLIMVGRYIRLIPLYALVFWFARHVAPLAGSGPMFAEYRTDQEHPRGHCAGESWATVWTMSAADVKIPMDCVPQAWYLSDDFRTLLVLPVYVLLLAKSMALGYGAIFVTLAYTLANMTRILREASIDYGIVLEWQPHIYALMLDRLHNVYTNFFVRMSTYLLGVILGHLLYLYETRQIREWPGWLRRYGIKLALLIGLMFFFAVNIVSSPLVSRFLPPRDQIHSDTVALLVPLFKTAMELCICVTLLLLLTGSGYKLVHELLHNRAMKILASISYAVFLTHIEILYKVPSIPLESNYWYLYLMSTFLIVSSHVLSFFLHLLYEMPINNLSRPLFKRAFASTN